MTEREALKLALEALNKLTDVFLDTEGNHGDYEQKAINQGNKAIDAIQEALAQPTSGDYALGYSIGFGEGHSAREALAQPEQEPCGGCGGSGWVPRDPDIGTDQECFVCDGSGAYPKEPEQEPVAFEKTVCPFCTSEWVTAEQHDRNVDRVERKPLTNEEITQAFNKAMAERPKDASNAETNRLFVRAIEAAHGIKGEA